MTEPRTPRLRIVVGTCHDPYVNLAAESRLLDNYQPDTVTLFLWQNERTVVIGANQNPYSECNVETLLTDGGRLARRRTGGGAVYHDLGNLNFSFVADKRLYDVARQMRVVQEALRHFGLETELSGRNDITFEGRKFSGNAFGFTKWQGLHHGTLLIKTDSKQMARYLNVHQAKLQKHGVRSVAARVVNLSEVAAVTAENMVQPLVEAFQDVYAGRAQTVGFDTLCDDAAQALCRQIQSDDYLYARWRNFRAARSAQFAWGRVDVDLHIDEAQGIIRSAAVASDSLQPEAIAQAELLLQSASITTAPAVPDGDSHDIVADIFSLIY